MFIDNPLVYAWTAHETGPGDKRLLMLGSFDRLILAFAGVLRFGQPEDEFTAEMHRRLCRQDGPGLPGLFYADGSHRPAGAALGAVKSSGNHDPPWR